MILKFNLLTLSTAKFWVRDEILSFKTENVPMHCLIMVNTHLKGWQAMVE
jgi:hypothetical protein